MERKGRKLGQREKLSWNEESAEASASMVGNLQCCPKLRGAGLVFIGLCTPALIRM